jgi:hypothetical protein
MTVCTDAAATAYAAWLRREGVVLKGVAMARFPDTGRGVVALRSLRPGETLVSVPDGAALLADTGCATAALASLGVLSDAAPRARREALVLAVAAELAAGSRSRWAPYMHALPQPAELHVPVAWRGDEARALRGTAVSARLRGAGGPRDELPSATTEAWHAVGARLAKRHPELRLPRGEDGAALHARATALVASCSFSLGRGGEMQAMVPFFDALNHAAPAEAHVRLHHDAQAGTLSMIAVRPVAPGQEVFNTYGPLGTSELVRRYGFAPPPGSNPHDCAEVGRRELAAAAEAAGPGPWEVRAGARLARAAGLLRRHARFKLPLHGAPPPDMLLALRVLCAGTQAAAADAARLRRCRAPRPPHPRDAEQLAATMRAALAAMAREGHARLGGSAADAARELRSCPPGAVRLQMALRARCAEHAGFTALARWAAGCDAAELLRPDDTAEALLWRRGVRAAARRVLLAARKRSPRPPDMSSPGVVQALALAGVVRFSPPPHRIVPALAVRTTDQTAAAAGPQCCACRAAACIEARGGVFTLPKA